METQRRVLSVLLYTIPLLSLDIFLYIYIHSSLPEIIHPTNVFLLRQIGSNRCTNQRSLLLLFFLRKVLVLFLSDKNCKNRTITEMDEYILPLYIQNSPLLFVEDALVGRYFDENTQPIGGYTHMHDHISNDRKGSFCGGVT